MVFTDYELCAQMKPGDFLTQLLAATPLAMLAMGPGLVAVWYLFNPIQTLQPSTKYQRDES
jgi:hypothetical protein